MLLNCGVGEDSWESPWAARRYNQSFLKEVSPEYSLEGLMLKLQTLATWWEELAHWKRPWCWERLKARGEGDDRGWDGWMASPTQWTWVWVSSRSWWWTGRPGVLQSMGSQTTGHDWATELNWVILGKFFSLDQSMEVAATQKRVEDVEVIWTSLPNSFSRSWEAQPRSGVPAG